jgi:hypothetical protein
MIMVVEIVRENCLLGVGVCGKCLAEIYHEKWKLCALLSEGSLAHNEGRNVCIQSPKMSWISYVFFINILS